MSALRDAIVLHLQADTAITAAVDAIRADAGIDAGLPVVYPGIPQKGVVYPFITVDPYRGIRMERVFRGGGTIADEIAFENGLFIVKAVDQNTSPKNVGDINALIRTALDGAIPTMAGYTAISVTLDSEPPLQAENYNGVTYQHEGGVYEIWAKKN